VTANIEPALVKKLVAAGVNGDINTLQDINRKLALLNEVLFVEANPIPAKYILYKKGFIKNELRLPLTSASQNAMEKIDKVLATMQ
jgi:4-hydroxy-tetrahydrodipicolinate synthase